jgi:hypothetical protein
LAPLALIVLGSTADVLLNGASWSKWGLNLAIIVLVLGVVLGYAAIRFGKQQVFQKFGVGDVLLLVAFPFLLPTTWMLYFLIAGAVVGILGFAVLSSFREKGAPLAGIYGFLLAAYFTVQLIS